MNVSGPSKFSCIIVGSTSLPIRCGEILLQEGHKIRAVVTPDRDFAKWCGVYGIPVLSSTEKIPGRVDYLFSIVNDHILRDDVLGVADKLAINYHDAPLPKYAGTHATSWAIMNGETIHGVTWHVITDTVDAGDILDQQRVDITSNDTAFTLNTKCYDAAIKSFTRLVDGLSRGAVQRQEQDLRERTFFPRFKRPDRLGLISWDQPATQISASVRALDFGDHSNPLGRPKVAIGDDIFILPSVSIAGSTSGARAGTVLATGADLIQISTADRDVVVRELLDVCGRPVRISDVVEKFGLRLGIRLDALSEEKVAAVEQLYKDACRNESYWVRKLSSMVPAEAPYANAAKVGESVYESLDVRLSDPGCVKRAAERNSLTEFSILSSLFVLLLARLEGLEEFDIGYQHGTRPGGVAPSQLFAGVTPFRVTAAGTENFVSVARHVKDEFFANERASLFLADLASRYPQLKRAAGPDSRFRFPVVLAVSDDPAGYTPPEGTDLVFLMSGNGTTFKWVYNQRVIAGGDVARLSSHLSVLLNGVLADPDTPIARLPLLTEDERHQILVEFNDNSIDFPAECIHNLFESQASRTPDKTAVVHGQLRVTYDELNRKANQIAAHLLTLGIKPEMLVGVCVDRSIEMLAGILGIMKAGGAYVPLDPAYPAERLARIIQDSRAPIVLTNQKHSSRFEQSHSLLVFLDADADKTDQCPTTNPNSAVGPANLAYVIYTSGSTGTPKGVAIEHRNASALIHWALTAFTEEQLRGVLASTSICFDLSVFEIFVPLSCGGSVILVENVLHLPGDPAADEVTLINTVPSAVTELLRIDGIPSSVDTVNLAGEPLKPSLVEQIYTAGTVREVFDLYGPTEDTTYSTYTLRNIGPATIGRPIANSQAYILDNNRQPLPVGLPGELYLGGAGLARGYLNRPEFTDERFVPNELDDRGGRLYRTGDLARFRQDGQIEYLGRIDNQVKIRGFRIELGEIESVLSKFPGIGEVTVVAREDQPGEKRLVAYFTCGATGTVSAAQLRNHVKQKLPEYMVPSFFVALDAIPLTPNGKIDRKALPKPAGEERTCETDDAMDELETQLAAIWERILDVRPIGPRDDFFELGGHSLKAVHMFVEIEETFGKNIPLATLFEAGTIEKLANILRQDGWEAPESSLVPIQTSGTNPPFFCVHAKGGNVLFYRDLARHLGTHQPFYGLQARRLGGRQIGHGSVEEMAAFYIKEIRALQPRGPYYVGGSSFGGLVAFEIGQQLRQQGEDLALLALLDTGTPDYPKLLPGTTKLRAKLYETLRRLQHHRDTLSLLNGKERFEYAASRVKKVKLNYTRKFQKSYKKAVRRFYSEVKGSGSLPGKYVQIEDQIWRAGQKYFPRPYSGKVTLFRASNQPLGIEPDPTLGWGQFVEGEIDIHEVPGHHGSIVAEPYVRILAEKLGGCIDRTLTSTEELTERDTGKGSEQAIFETARIGI